MGADDALEVILRACERLRRLPESRWRRPPMPPLGARAPQQAPATSGPSLEALVSGLIVELMREDAAARKVEAFAPDVPVFALADVLAALAKSVAEHAPTSAALTAAAGAVAAW